MRILFISSGNSKSGIGSIVRKQGDSLIKSGIDLSFFTINKKGLTGYIASVPELRKKIKNTHYDVLHAHYSFSGFTAVMALSGLPVVVSLMGSDAMKKGLLKQLTKFFCRFFWSRVIVKSKSMKKAIGYGKSVIIPNGVDFDLFKPASRKDALADLKLSLNKKYVIFVADPARFEKNFQLARGAVSLLEDKDVELLPVYDVPHRDIPKYMNAAEVLVLTSLWEGSPNVIKEAMACNLPVVSTDVGDVKEVISNTEGCYIAPFEPEGFALQLKKALDFNQRTNGRENIRHLDEKIIAQKILDIYKSVV